MTKKHSVVRARGHLPPEPIAAQCDANISSDPVSIAERDVIAERRRQVSAEGWDKAHDDKHTDGCLALAAASYAAYAGAEALRADTQPQKNRASEYQFIASQTLWPFDREWWKPKNPRRDLVRAAALLIAEIERIDRGAK